MIDTMAQLRQNRWNKLLLLVLECVGGTASRDSVLKIVTVIYDLKN